MVVFSVGPQGTAIDAVAGLGVGVEQLLALGYGAAHVAVVLNGGAEVTPEEVANVLGVLERVASSVSSLRGGNCGGERGGEQEPGS